MTSTQHFIEYLVSEVPELRPMYSEHLRDNDELLPHVFLGEVTQFFVNATLTIEQPHPRDPPSMINRLASCLRAGATSDDPQVRELITVSFLENLRLHDMREVPLQHLLGDVMWSELMKIGA